MKQVVSKLLISIFVFGLGVMALDNSAFSQDGSLFEDTDADPIPTREVGGRVLRIENDKLFIETNEGIREVSVPSNVSVTRNLTEASINDIQLNDRVTVILSGTGQVLSVEATSGQVFDWAKLGLPLILLGLLVVGLIIYFIRKGQQPKIMTEAHQTQTE